jgi:hypothetical protein
VTLIWGKLLLSVNVKGWSSSSIISCMRVAVFFTRTLIWSQRTLKADEIFPEKRKNYYCEFIWISYSNFFWCPLEIASRPIPSPLVS